MALVNQNVYGAPISMHLTHMTLNVLAFGQLFQHILHVGITAPWRKILRTA
jgi:hypothetical protein